jgi:MFS family permease
MRFMDPPAPVLADDVELRTLRRCAILGCLIGNLFEFYDLGVYAFFAAAIGHAIFPSIDPMASILSRFATFGVGFLMRPIGTAVIGSYGDRLGRHGCPAARRELVWHASDDRCGELSPEWQ